MSVVGLLLPGAIPAAKAQASAAVQTAPSVQQAQDGLEQARARMQATQERLDALAGSFENARSHAERLAADLGQAEVRVGDVEAALARAQSAQAQEIRSAYMQPGVDLLRLSGAFLLAPDVGTALHASAMMQQVAANRAAHTEATRRAGRQVTADVTSQRGIATGTNAALQDLESLSASFTAALDTAVGDVAAAEALVGQAEEAARQAAEEAAAAAAAQIQIQPGGAVLAGAPAPVIRIATVNGGTQEMTCPLGQPNGFIDSWGFPRSGGRRHQGVDMFAAYGMPVVAAADGYVRRVFNNALGGLSIDLVDVLGNRYYYAHLSATYVVSGQAVQAGQLMAANGNSGNAISTPPHLHFQFHPADGGPVNPFPLAAALCR
ncbi:MAG TPA: peptidoglycan DD-metalloendopeptidase family protein [Euzebya sp.]|nr:peptidoglycan DD-metalloendopeptidase family protein [Euzebya sp.]